MKNEILALVALIADCTCVAGSVKPILRIGAMTDSHLMPNNVSSHRRAKACFELFRRHNVDVVINTGDIAAQSQVSELKIFRRMFDETFAGTGCVPIFGIAYHDYNYIPNTWKPAPKQNDPLNIEAAWRALGMTGPNPTAVVKGYRFVNVFSNERPGVFAEMVEKAVAENEGNRPVFVINHVPPARTTTATEGSSSKAVRDVLNKYPQVVALTGHIHSSISWAANIWQGEFTAVNLGANATDSNKMDGEAVLLDVFSDRIDIRRYEAVTGREVGVDDRWSVPLPLDPAHGPYRVERRRKTSPVAECQLDAKVQFKQSGREGFGVFEFPSALPHNVSYRYDLAFESRREDGGWDFLTAFTWDVPQVFDEPGTQNITLPMALFDSGRPYRATIRSVNSYNVAGKGRSFGFSAPVWSARELPSELTRIVRFQNSVKANDKGFRPGSDGWFERRGKMVAAVLSKDFSTAIAGAKSVSLLLDIASADLKGVNKVRLAYLPEEGRANFSVGGCAYAVSGDYPNCRYAWTLCPQSSTSDGEYCIVFREDGSGRFKVKSVRGFITF